MIRPLANGALLARITLRHGWPKLVPIALLIGVVGGLVLAAAAGAARTSSAVDRMIEETAAAHVLVNPDRGVESDLEFESVARLAMVEDASRSDGVFLLDPGEIDSLEDLDAAPGSFATDGGHMFAFGRPVITAGRIPDPAAADEVFVDANFAEREGVAVGDRLTWRVPSTEEIASLFEAGSIGEVFEIVNDPSFATTVTVAVTGIGTTVDGVAVDEGFEPLAIVFTPAFYEEYGRPSAGWWGASVRLRDPAMVDDFRAAVDALVPGELIAYQTLAENEAKAERATAPGATALRVFASVVGAVGFVLVAQAFSRRLQFDAHDVEALSVLGTTTRDRFAAALMRIAATAVGGGVLAVGLAWLVSPLTPVGPARRVEVDPGFRLDAPVVLGGAAILVCVVVAAAAVPAWRWSRRRASGRAPRPSLIAARLSSLGAGPSLTTGVRFGLEPGRGRNSVPVRATTVAAATAMAVVVAVVVFAASLDRVVDEPRFHGLDYDVLVELTSEEPDAPAPDVARVVAALAADEAVRASGHLRIAELSVDGRPLTSYSITGGADGVQPTIAEGRSPGSVDEIALGGDTMRRLGVDVGDEVDIVAPGFEGAAAVVGRAVLPGFGLYSGHDRMALGTGGVVVTEVLGPVEGGSHGFFVASLRPGADREAFEGRMTGQLSEIGSGVPVFADEMVPADVQSLVRLRDLPLTLAAVLVGLVGTTVVHAMVVASQTRRRDLAVLQCLGATAPQVRMIGLWQGLTLGAVAIAVGLPIGLIAGRWSWSVLADRFGTLAEPVIPAPGVLAAASLALLSAGVLGLGPAHRGLRRSPAEVLRDE